MYEKANAIWAAAALLVLCQPSVSAQAPGESAGGWSLGATGMVASWGVESDPFDRFGGPGIQVDLYRPRGMGVGMRAGYIVSTGFYGMVGAWGQTMVNYAIPAGRHQLQLKGGAAGFWGNDSDGSVYAGGGPVAGAGILLRPSRRLGVQVDGFGQVLYVPDDLVWAPGLSAGLMWLPGGAR